MEILIGVLSFVAGFIIGCVVLHKRNKPQGTIAVNLSDPMKELFVLEIGNIENITNKDQVVLNIEKR